MPVRSQACGSSPLTRGKLRAPFSHRDMVRLIPAHAGKTALSASICAAGSAHPRSRGENPMSGEAKGLIMGSSPLTRGKRQMERRHEGMAGLIPAHAGKTTRCTLSGAACAAHPRSRGENHVLAVESAQEFGSSPLTRGKPTTSGTPMVSARLIPAHAGKTDRPVNCMSVTPAHPRSRGENCVGGAHVNASRGSSPLTRGKQRP